MRLSIVTITFNAEKSISRTMDSVLLQTVPVYEYILIDGASTDKTNEIIESYRDKFENKKIQFIHISEKDEGISDAFNKGISIATGDLIGIINSDDELMLETVNILKENYSTKIDVFYGNCLWIDNENDIQYERKAKQDISNIRYEMVMIHPSTFVKKDAYEHYGKFNTDYKYCMDEELLTRFYEAGASFKYINVKLTKFKAGGISDSYIKKTLEEGLKLALDMNKPFYCRAYGSYAYKYVRYYISKFMKKNHIFKVIKKDVSICDNGNEE